MKDKENQEGNSLRRAWRKLRHTYSLVLFERGTFEQKRTVNLTPLGLLLLGGAAFLLIVGIVFSAIAFTPLKRHLPDYPGERMEKQSIEAIAKADSLEEELDLMKDHFSRIRAVFDGDTLQDSSRTASFQESPEPPSEERTNTSKVDKRGTEHPPLFTRYFFPPLRGAVTDAFDRSEDHFGVDLTTSKGEAIKAILEGTVTFASWTPEQGNVIQLQHPNGLLSVYKHNSVLLKETGQRVRTGDPIAIIGNTGELTTGPHLHFELWYKGDPIDPQEVLVF